MSTTQSDIIEFNKRLHRWIVPQLTAVRTPLLREAGSEHGEAHNSPNTSRNGGESDNLYEDAEHAKGLEGTTTTQGEDLDSEVDDDAEAYRDLFNILLPHKDRYKVEVSSQFSTLLHRSFLHIRI